MRLRLRLLFLSWAGWLIETVSLIKEIAARGHEVASHGYSHQLIYNQTPDVFREETIRSKSLLEDIVQMPVQRLSRS